MTKVLLTGAAGYIADQILPTFRERYETILVDVKDTNRQRRESRRHRNPGPDRSGPGVRTPRLFEGVDAVVHLGYKRRSGDNPLEHFFIEKENVEMAYNVFRTAYDAGVSRVVMASSNHAADWYEHNLIHARKMESLDPYWLPLSDNFYGWAKATYEHMGFLFACGAMDFQTATGSQDHTGAAQRQQRKLEVVMVRIGAPRDLDLDYLRWRSGQLQARPRRIPQSARPDAAIREVYRDAQHRERARHTLAGRVRDQQQHPRVLVAVQRPRGAGIRARGRLRDEVRRRHQVVSARATNRGQQRQGRAGLDSTRDSPSQYRRSGARRYSNRYGSHLVS